MLHFQNVQLFRERRKLHNIFLYVWSTGSVQVCNVIVDQVMPACRLYRHALTKGLHTT